MPSYYATAANLNLKANIANPTFTGTPKAPTAAQGTNNTQIATTAFVMTAINAISSQGKIVSYSLQQNGYVKWDIGLILQWVFEAVKSTQSTLSYPIPFKEILLAGFFSTNNRSGFCEKLSSYNTANATTYQYQACYGGFLLALGTA